MAILIADQSASVRSLLRLLLEGAGHVVSEVVDSSLALAASAGQEFGLVILDGGLAPETGLETARRIHAARPGQPMVLMSQGPETAVFRSDATGVGVIDILAKPVVPHVLLRLIRKLVTEPGV